MWSGKIEKKIDTAKRALKTLQELLDLENPTTVERDAVIQRFEYTFEAFWKVGKLFLREMEGLEIGSPKGVIRGFLQIAIFTEDQTALALDMVDDRNLTSHAYKQDLADKIYNQIGDYAEIMVNWLVGMEKALENTEKIKQNE